MMVTMECFRAYALAFGAIGLAVCLAWLGAIWAARTARLGYGGLRRAGGASAVVLFALWAIAALRSTDKPKDTLRVEFRNGVVSAEPSRGTNSTAYIRWAIDPSFRPFPISPDTLVYIDCRPLGSSDEWTGLEIAGVPAGDLSWTGDVPGGGLATNFEYCVYSGYVPPEPVHTNGVWMVKGLWYEGQEGSRAMPMHMKFVGDGEAVYPKEIE